MVSKISKQVSSHGTVNNLDIAGYLLASNAITSSDEKSDWNVRIWEPKNCSSNNMIMTIGNRGHLSLIFESITRTEWKAFTIELALRGNKHDKISLYSYIFAIDNVKKYGLSGRREILPSKNDSSIKSSFIVKNKSVDDLVSLARTCIKQWRWYSLLFFNCRDFVYRFSLHLQKDNKRFGHLLPYIPVLYDGWFISLSIASAFAFVYAITYRNISRSISKSLLSKIDDPMKLIFKKDGKLEVLDISREVFLGQLHNFIGFATFVFIAGNLCIGSLQLMHQNPYASISSIKNDEKQIEKSKSNDLLYLSACGALVSIGIYFGIKYAKDLSTSLRSCGDVVYTSFRKVWGVKPKK